MTNPMINPQPNYSGVTIQITNPAVNVGQNNPAQTATIANGYGGQTANNYCTCPNCYPQQYYTGFNQANGMSAVPNSHITGIGQEPQNKFITNPNGSFQEQQNQTQNNGAYPPQYYLNNYNYQYNNPTPEQLSSGNNTPQNLNQASTQESDKNGAAYSTNLEKANITPLEQDLTKSQDIIKELNQRAIYEEETKKQSKQKRVVALTDEYIKSLENYLDNPNNEVRLMASKEVIKRLDEDKERFEDPALNALLNKMLQDPSKLIRIASLSAFNSRLASGNDYTVQLLQNIQMNPNADKEDVLQATDILLKMSSVTELKNVPYPVEKRKNNIEDKVETVNIKAVERNEENQVI